MEIFTAGDRVYSYGKVFLLGLVRHGVISSGNIYVWYVNGSHCYTSTLHAKIKSDNNLISFLIYWSPRKMFITNTVHFRKFVLNLALSIDQIWLSHR